MSGSVYALCADDCIFLPLYTPWTGLIPVWFPLHSHRHTQWIHYCVFLSLELFLCFFSFSTESCLIAELISDSPGSSREPPNASFTDVCSSTKLVFLLCLHACWELVENTDFFFFFLLADLNGV